MKKKIARLFTVCAFLGLSLGILPRALAMSTEQKYQQSKVIIIATKNEVAFYAEPGRDSLTLGFYPKGTIFVPINQTRNNVEGKVYNLAIRFDGAVGWLCSDDVALSRK